MTNARAAKYCVHHSRAITPVTLHHFATYRSAASWRLTVDIGFFAGQRKMNKGLLRAGLLVSTLAVCDSALAATDIYNITAQEHAACDGDAVRLCMAAYPDVQKLLSCMASHRAQLNPICLAAFDTGLKRRHLHVPDLSASAQ